MTVRIFISCIALLFCLRSWAQKQHSLLLEFGLNRQIVLDKRFMANADHLSGFNFTIGHAFTKPKRFNSVTLRTSKNYLDPSEFAYFHHLKSDISYTHMRSLKKQIWLGGYANYGSNFGFPSKRGNWSDNNAISYSLWVSTGLAAKYQRKITIRERPFIIRLSGTIPLLGYVVRPAHGHPYPEKYLKDGVFDFSREGMAKTFFTSGKIRTLNSFWDVKTSIGLVIPFGKKAHHIGINYNWEYLQIKDDRPIWNAQHHFSIYSKINF